MAVTPALEATALGFQGVCAVSDFWHVVCIRLEVYFRRHQSAGNGRVAQLKSKPNSVWCEGHASDCIGMLNGSFDNIVEAKALC